MNMQWSNSKLNSPFSKIPLLVCSLMMTVGTDQLFAGAQDIPSALEVKTEEEAFLVRRIAEFWKDRDYVLVKRQIHTFLEKFPKSPINDQLRGILGDLCLQDKKYQEALDAYSKITESAIAEKVIVNRLQCHYEMNNFEALYKEGKPYLALNPKKLGDRKDELNFLVAESLFRLSLEAHDTTVKTDYAAQAKALYEPLLSSNFSKHTKLALAEVYHILKQYEKASSLYLELVQIYPEQKEDLIYQAALSQAEYNPSLAILTFSDVISLKGSKAHDSSINRLILYFQQEEFAEVIKNYSGVLAHINSEKKPTIDYMIGRSYFALEDYKKASDFLGQYISTQTDATLQLKNALLMQLNCSQQNHKDDLCDATLEKFKNFFSEDKEFGQALYIHAIMAKNRGDYDLAEQELHQILLDNKFDDKQSLYLEYGLVTHENSNWNECYSTFKLFIDLYPKSEHRNVAHKYYLSSALNRLKDIENNQDGYNKSNFYDDLNFVLNEQSSKKNVLSSDEEKDCRLLLAKTAYELKRFSISSKQIESFIKDYPVDANMAEAFLILGICHQNLDSDPELFYSNIEKAISLNPDFSNQSSLHLQLFNSYLSKIERIQSTTSVKNINPNLNNSLYDLAGEHLYKAISLGDSNVKFDNKLWLANHFYQKVKQDPKHLQSDHFKRGLELYKSILTSNDQTLVSITPELSLLEAEVLKYADLLSLKGLLDVKVDLLSKLVEQQTKNNQVTWNFHMQTLLELAQSYEMLKDDENALETYSFITKISRGSSSYVSDYALLHGTRIRFSMLDPENKKDTDEHVLSMLNDLKDLQIKKSPSSEPIHLEAGLTYAKIRSEISPKDEKDEKYLFYLGRMKEDFTLNDDSVSKEYHKRLTSSQEKQDVYKTYMAFLDAEILRVRANLEIKQNHLAQAEEYNSLALIKLSEVKNSDKITNYLNENIQKSMHMIDQLNHF